MKTCEFTGCGRPHFARTLCHTHYQQSRAGKTLTAIKPRRASSACLLRDGDGRKHCIRCDRWVHLGEFVTDPSHADGLSTYCKPCRSAQMRAWRYGATAERVAQMIHNQDGRCLFCPAALAGGYCIDHNHACCPGPKSCGRCVRGLLCQECNKLLGKLEGDRERLGRMLAYMDEESSDARDQDGGR